MTFDVNHGREYKQFLDTRHSKSVNAGRKSTGGKFRSESVRAHNFIREALAALLRELEIELRRQNSTDRGGALKSWKIVFSQKSKSSGRASFLTVF